MSLLHCSVGGVHLRNPVIMASGTYGFGAPYAKLYPPARLGGISTKGLTVTPRGGNKGTRLVETPSGLMNSIGLENPGVAHFLNHELDMMCGFDTAIIVNLGGGSLEEYETGAAMIEEASRTRAAGSLRAPDMIELNISCPNVKEGGMQFGLHTETAREAVRIVRRATTLPLVVKLSPNAADLTGMAAMCEAEGADGISLVNTFLAMSIDIRARRSSFRQLYAGLSGPAIKPIALRMVHQVCKTVAIPVIGMGGISNASDILEFIMAGAEAIQIGTGNFSNPRCGGTIADELAELMAREGIESLGEVRGMI